MLAAPCVPASFSFPRFGYFDLIIRRPAALSTTSKYDSDHGGITVCSATLISFRYGNFVTGNTSLAATELNSSFSYNLRPG